MFYVSVKFDIQEFNKSKSIESNLYSETYLPTLLPQKGLEELLITIVNTDTKWTMSKP